MLVRSLNSRAPLPPAGSLEALDWLNFFLAALLMGFGPFVTVYLADRGWVPESIGFVLTASGLAGLVTQVPGGELIDAVKAKRAVAVPTTARLALPASMSSPRSKPSGRSSERRPPPTSWWS